MSNFHIFQTIRRTSPQIWGGNGGASDSPNVAYLACWGRGVGGSGVDFSPYFSPLKSRYVLWSGASYSPKNTVDTVGKTRGQPGVGTLSLVLLS